MRRVRFPRLGVVLALCVAMARPGGPARAEEAPFAGATPAATPTRAAGPAMQPPRVIDVALGPQGSLTGQLVDANGAPRAGAPVAVFRDGQIVAQTQTDAGGQFAFSGLRGGAQQLLTAGGGTPARMWTASTAPPAAQRSVLLTVDSADALRAQNGAPFNGYLPNVLFVTGAVTLALTGIILGYAFTHRARDRHVAS